MNKNTLISIVLLVAFVALLGWVQVLIKNERTGIRVEEKILMLSDRPEVTKIMALGFEGAMADLLWIRAIQYFGGNFSSLDEPEKREGLINLFRNMFVLDPHFVEAYKFAGFVTNESIKDPELAIDFLLRGARHNPDAWRLPFEAGFIAFYQMEEYELAKDLFIQAAYGAPFANVEVENIEGTEGEEPPFNLIDGAIDTEMAFQPNQGSVTIDLSEVKEVGRITLKQNVYRDDTFRTSYTTDLGSSYEVIESINKTNFHNLDDPIEARYFQFDQFQPAEEGQPVLIADIQFFDPRHPEAPSYVDRMAIEMDRSSGRFSAAWNQYLRYLEEAQRTGDQVSAKLAIEKLNSIYNQKAREIITEAVELYQDETDSLPSMDMRELIEGGYIQRIINQKIVNDPNFSDEVFPVIFRNKNPRDVLTTMDGESPFYLIKFEDEQGLTDWYLATYQELKEQQQSMINRLQRHLDKFQNEVGRLPESLTELKTQDWFTEDDMIFVDPLQGEFYIGEQGQVKARGGLNRESE